MTARGPGAGAGPDAGAGAAAGADAGADGAQGLTGAGAQGSGPADAAGFGAAPGEGAGFGAGAGVAEVGVGAGAGADAGAVADAGAGADAGDDAGFDESGASVVARTMLKAFFGSGVVGKEPATKFMVCCVGAGVGDGAGKRPKPVRAEGEGAGVPGVVPEPLELKGHSKTVVFPTGDGDVRPGAPESQAAAPTVPSTRTATPVPIKPTLNRRGWAGVAMGGSGGCSSTSFTRGSVSSAAMCPISARAQP